MRKLLWFSVGFGLCCMVCAYGMDRAWLFPIAIVVLVLSVAVTAFSRKREVIRPLVAILAGGLAGLLWFGIYYLVYLQPVTALDGQEITLSLTASDYSYETNYGIGVDTVLMVEGKPYRVQTYLNEKAEIKPGDTIEGTFRLRLATADEENTSTYYQGQGIFLFAYQTEKATVNTSGEIPGWCFPAVLRQKIAALLEKVLPQDSVFFAKALLLGDGRELDYETETALKVSGIRHIIAVSGLHISILYGLVCIVTLRNRFLTALIGMPVLLLFAAVAGLHHLLYAPA